MKHFKCSIFSIENLNIKSSDLDKGKGLIDYATQIGVEIS